MTHNKLSFLKAAFGKFEIRFSDDLSSAVISNPHYDENIIVYDDMGYEFIVCFSFQHRHFTDEEKVIEWINDVILGNLLVIEFFHNEQRRFGSEIAAKELQGLSYEMLERFTGYYGPIKLSEVADSFKVRGWDGKNNFDFAFVRETDETVSISKVYVGIQ